MFYLRLLVKLFLAWYRRLTFVYWRGEFAALRCTLFRFHEAVCEALNSDSDGSMFYFCFIRTAFACTVSFAVFSLSWLSCSIRQVSGFTLELRVKEFWRSLSTTRCEDFFAASTSILSLFWPSTERTERADGSCGHGRAASILANYSFDSLPTPFRPLDW